MIHQPSSCIGRHSLTILAISCLLGPVPAEAAVRYKAGDQGPAGGIVFYITDGGYGGLEAAPKDLGWALWGCNKTEIDGANGTAIGTGEKNTEAIAAACGKESAAGKTSDYTLNNYDDWYLPSKDELSKFWEFYDIAKWNPGGEKLESSFAAMTYYWSSSQSSNIGAWAQYLLHGDQMDDSKDNVYHVIPVRRIEADPIKQCRKRAEHGGLVTFGCNDTNWNKFVYIENHICADEQYKAYNNCTYSGESSKHNSECAQKARTIMDSCMRSFWNR
jgi:hypothetical protein